MSAPMRESGNPVRTPWIPAFAGMTAGGQGRERKDTIDTVSIRIAKKTLSQLLMRVEAGEEIVLARGTKPVAKMVPLHLLPTKRRFGALHSVISVGSEFFEPLPEEELGAWE